MKKKVLLLGCLSDDGRSMDVKDYYLFFRGSYKEPLLLTSIGNCSEAVRSLTNQELILNSSFLNFLAIPLTSSTQFLLRADVREEKSILKLTVDEKKLQLEPFTEYDELTEEMFYHIVQCFTLKRKDKYLSFLLQPRRDRILKQSLNPVGGNNNNVRIAKKPYFS
ncbi:hypothetical protein D3H55_06395 [Bacillus salacetis]|uniref:Uncharacterized protein n=1 Tax=Bacillus salacetis TaxID=2315464 RepID=A0A3A1R3S2_9BACI|nr:hypothetical protein [Bacillus salacetis]RIW36085.1 hypothetical protein D3H55_06395 [Bacillus salacetis]